MNWVWPVLLAVILILTLSVVVALRRRRARQQIQFISNILAQAVRSPGEPRVVISLSTLPDRIANLESTLRCLSEQTRRPDEIILAVPDFSIRQSKAYDIPEFLESYSRVRILRCGKDWGPATKSIPVLQEELAAGRGDTLIMIVDDDRTYPLDALETYLHYHHQLPDAVLAFRGAPMPRSLKWDPKIIRGDRIKQPRRVAVITGCGSYLIQPRFFDSQFWDYSGAPRALFYMDDIWISGWLDRRQVEKYVIPASAMMQTVREQSGTMTLYDVPRSRRYNNNEAIAFFADSWNVF